jgi:hypothetical protein
MLRYLLLSIIILLAPQNTQACSCNCFKTDVPVEEIDGLMVPKKDAPNKSALIFEGTFVTFEIKGDHLALSFEVLHYYKGKETATQIEILTSRGDCGFRAKMDSKCLIFAYEHKGSLHTYSSECSRSVSQEQEETKYTQYKRFLELITNKPDGTYQFKRLENDIYSCKPFRGKTVPELNLQFTIKDNQLDGEWLLYNFDGTILEKGNYKKGIRFGKWTLGTRKIRFATPKPE